MHAAIVHLSPILAAEKSKTPFYIAGGVLVAWALIVSLGLGLREAGFPRTVAAERAVMAVTAVLVAVAVSMAVATSGGSTKEAKAAGSAGTAIAPSGAERSAGASSASTTGGTSPRSRAGGGGPAKTNTSAAKTGSTATGASAQAQTKLAQAADPSGQLRFAKTSLTARAGKVSIDFSNSSPLPHNLTIASGNTVLGATPAFNGGSKTLTLKLKAGTYKFYCSVPGHREAGMEGTLVVR
jgi:plastocyanin